MKKCILFSSSFILLIAASCSGHKDKDDNGSYTPPKAGTIVVADSMQTTSDPLNKFMFSVTVSTNDNSQQYGTYDVNVKCGPNEGTGQFSMPHGGEKQKPILRKGATPDTYVIGFHYGKDTTFYDYYEVRTVKHGIQSNIEMKYLKAYSFK